ncbi:MAG: type II toxin-antitoxin system Phd/YefM family antitoxin [Nitrospirales bacterium]|nr:type II toxin-antitoxin system Phd/YefM family antitoxin [Nitrospira sp.]MCA9480171.1 type II toxin-antitoxin system Phd/YefM family antitoxin [Nitrospira sp.]MCB9709867.1 type II toxin-antitoxin system Phd/YefM family antitoxin [Nitrospiraceae bacterium]MDR4485927.1 type II toxin-antitoxin system Phd/YefM family antitoxin [Nitrospirales bacterium]MDR4489254.1 type II toxin-antitoxin system Phd/YefM family antitoxin [Nitrospirales bacterium]
MPHVDQYVSVTQAKTQLLDLIRRLGTQQDSVGITKDGVPTAVLLSMDHFEGLMETLEILSDPKTIRPLRKSLKQAQSGRWETHEAVFPREEV